MNYCIITGEPNPDIHHLLSRKSHPEYKDCEWNKIPLSRQKHQEIHAIGRTSFIGKYKLEQEMIRRGFEFINDRWIWPKE